MLVVPRLRYHFRPRPLHVLERQLASVVNPDVDHMPPAVLDLAVVLHMELNGLLADTVQRDLQARRVNSSCSRAVACHHLCAAVLQRAAAEGVDGLAVVEGSGGLVAALAATCAAAPPAS